MMLVRDDIEANDTETQPYESLMEDLESIRGSLESIRGRAVAATSYNIAEALWEVVIGAYDNNEVSPILLRLDEIDDLMTSTADADIDEDVEFDVPSPSAPFFSTTEETAARTVSSGSESRVENFLDVIPEAVVRDVTGPTSQVSRDDEEFVKTGLLAEIVSDEDFDGAVGVSRRVGDAGDEVHENKEPSELVLYSLRALDIAFFVVEKTYTVVIPKSMLIAQTASRRFHEVQESGKGSKGWKPVRNAANAKGRY
jgi:hypothetical protein